MSPAPREQTLNSEEFCAVGEKLKLASAEMQRGLAAFEAAAYPEAWKLLQNALRLYREELGPLHPSIAEVMALLARTAAAREHYPQAVAAAREALDIYQNIFLGGLPGEQEVLDKTQDLLRELEKKCGAACGEST